MKDFIFSWTFMNIFIILTIITGIQGNLFMTIFWGISAIMYSLLFVKDVLKTDVKRNGGEK